MANKNGLLEEKSNCSSSNFSPSCFECGCGDGLQELYLKQFTLWYNIMKYNYLTKVTTRRKWILNGKMMGIELNRERIFQRDLKELKYEYIFNTQIFIYQMDIFSMLLLLSLLL